jgi:hypothetical protein
VAQVAAGLVGLNLITFFLDFVLQYYPVCSQLELNYSFLSPMYAKIPNPKSR